MNALAFELRLLLDLVAAPRTACTAIATRMPVGAALVVLGGVQAALFACQAVLLQPLLRADPLLAAEGDGSPALWSGWALRGITALFWPAGCALRGAALATVLQGGAALAGQALPWRRLWSLAVHLELVFCGENAAATALLWRAQPADLEALRALHVRAGADLIWPDHGALTRWLEAGNAFVLWWTLLLALALRTWIGRRRAPVLLAACVGTALVLLRRVTLVL